MTIDRRSLRSASREPSLTGSPAPSTPLAIRATTPTPHASTSTPTPAAKPRGRPRKSEGKSTPVIRDGSAGSVASGREGTPRRSSRATALVVEVEVDSPATFVREESSTRVQAGSQSPTEEVASAVDQSIPVPSTSTSMADIAIVDNAVAVEAPHISDLGSSPITPSETDHVILNAGPTDASPRRDRVRREASPRGSVVPLEVDQGEHRSTAPKMATSESADAESPSESSGGSILDSDAETDSAASSSATSDADSDSDSVTEVNPSDLLAAALASLRAKELEAKLVAEERERGKVGGELDEDVMLLSVGDEGQKKRKERPIPGLQIPTLPSHPLKLHLAGPEPKRSQLKKVAQATPLSSSVSPAKVASAAREKRPHVPEGATGSSNGLGGMLGGLARAHGVTAERSTGGRGTAAGRGKGKSKESEEGPEMDTGEYQKQLTRREKAKMPRTQSSAAEWASLPTIPSSLLPQLKRDYQALNLGNSLDPKRFMKGGRGKEASGKIPESFGIGTMISQPRHLQTSTLPRERAYVPGSIVSALVGEQEISGYAKRKFGELQEKRMANGRGNGWKKRRAG